MGHIFLELEIQDLVWEIYLRKLKTSPADGDRANRRALHSSELHLKPSRRKDACFLGMTWGPKEGSRPELAVMHLTERSLGKAESL